MAVFARLYDFTIGQLRKSSEMNQEFDNIVNFFNGIDINKRASIKSANTIPVLIVNQNSDGPIFYAKRNGVLKLSVENTGQVKSYVTGIAPIDIANNTLITNLNVDLLDGLHATQLLGVNSEFSKGTQNFFLGVPNLNDKKYFSIEGIRLTKIKVQQQNGVASSDAQTQITFRTDVAVPTTIGSIIITGTVTSVQSVTVADFDLTGVNRIYGEITTIGGSNKHGDISVVLITEQIPVNPV